MIYYRKTLFGRGPKLTAVQILVAFFMDLISIWESTAHN